MYRYLFGPVPSRRLGMSLGIDLVPHKVCSLDCVYCECGATTLHTIQRKEYVLLRKAEEELIRYFRDNPDPDYITFSGSGEPTLNSRIGEMIDIVKKLKPEIPTALLTNGTLLSDKSLRSEILGCSIILPSLDAATDNAFRAINKPAEGIGIQDYIKGLIELRKEFSGEIWLEVMILPGYNNDPENLAALKKAIEAIQPHKIQLNTLDRPGTVENLQAAPRTELNDIIRQWGLPNAEVISAAASRKRILAYREDTESAILETISRRPCTAIDLGKILGLHINEVNKYLDVLEAEDKVETRRKERGLFYQFKK